MENNEIIYISQKGTWVSRTNPEKLDFINEEIITIRYLMPLPQESRELKLNIDSPSSLECNDLIGMKICKVPLSHFEGKYSGYYYTHHLNHLNTYSIYYDSNPLSVLLPWKRKVEIGIEDKDNINLIKIGPKGILYFVTNYNDTENIFNPSELEEFTFQGNFTGSKENDTYLADCKFWKPRSENIRIAN